MSRKLVTVRKIDAIWPIDGADFIEIVEIDGWQCIAKKGEFEIGSPCVYFEIDSFLPADDPRYEFLVKRGTKTDESGRERVRIKSMKMRGEISQGLALPYSSFPEIHDSISQDVEGEYWDYSEQLDVIKYERPEPQQANAAGRWPHFLQKTDEERIQNLWKKWSQKYKGVKFIPTLKLDGSSCTVAVANESIPGYELTPNEEFFGESEDQQKVLRRHIDFGNSGNDILESVDILACSRNLQLKFDPENHFWKAILRDSIIRKAATRVSGILGRPIAIQGEVMGPGIQGNKEKLNEYRFYAFDIYDILNRRYLDYSVSQKLFDNLDVNSVPVLGEPFCPFDEFQTLNELLEYADGPSLNSKYREGVVFKSIGLDVPVSFKVISNKWLLKCED